MRIEDIEYQCNGTRLVGQLVVDDTVDGRRPGVLVNHDFLGLRAHTKDIAVRLAELGYVAFATDYHGNGEVLAPDAIGARYGELASDAVQVRQLAHAALDVLRADDRVDPSRLAATGYCFGGTVALELARSGADLRAVVGFHSGLSTTRPEDAANITAKVLVCIGADDPIIPLEQRAAFEAEMRGGGVDWQMHVYGGVGHSFTNTDLDGADNPAMKYDQRADEQSWAAMLEHFERFL
jgi:dienelactone hydrolase